MILLFLFIYFLGGTGCWTWHCACNLSILEPSPLLFLLYFSGMVLCFLPSLPEIMILLPPVVLSSWDHRCAHYAQLGFWKMAMLPCLPELLFNSDPPISAWLVVVAGVTDYYCSLSPEFLSSLAGNLKKHMHKCLYSVISQTCDEHYKSYLDHCLCLYNYLPKICITC